MFTKLADIFTEAVNPDSTNIRVLRRQTHIPQKKEKLELANIMILYEKKITLNLK